MKPIPSVKFREVLFLFVYAVNFSEQDNMYELSEMIMDELKVSRSSVRIASAMALEIIQEKKWLDNMIEDVVVGYSLDRLKSVEHAILWVCLFQMMRVQEKSTDRLPVKIAIAEGKRLAKKFATAQASQFIHAIVAAVAHKHELFFEEEDEKRPNLQENLLLLEEEERKSEKLCSIRDQEKELQVVKDGYI